MQNNPEILIVNVQRTTFTNSTVGKSMQAVSIPRYLDVTPWLEPHQFNAGSVAKYRLSSVVSHIGTDSKSGHYICHARVARGMTSGISSMTILLLRAR